MHTEEASQDSELNITMRDAMWRGHGGWEMALTPVIFGAFGWLVDGFVGTRPFIMLIAAVVGLAGSVANQYYQYTYRMELETQDRRATLEAQYGSTGARFTKTEMQA